MSREVRRVPASWQHPCDALTGKVKPLLSGTYKEIHAEWVDGFLQWQKGLMRNYGPDGGWVDRTKEFPNMTYSEYAGREPAANDYMPQWQASECTHYQLYETTSEGTPISPVMESPEALAKWLEENKASAFGSHTATYAQWLAMINRGSCVSAVITQSGIKSGVEACV